MISDIYRRDHDREPFAQSGKGWANELADHYVVQYRREINGRQCPYQYLFVVRMGVAPLLPEEGTEEEIRAAMDQYRPGYVITVDGKSYLTTEAGPHNLEIGDMALNPWTLLEDLRIFPEGAKLPEDYKGRKFVVGQRSDIEKIPTPLLLELFNNGATRRPGTPPRKEFKDRKQAVEYVWNLWLGIPLMLLRKQDSPDRDALKAAHRMVGAEFLESGAAPTPAPVKPRGSAPARAPRKQEDAAESSQSLTRTESGKEARRKAGTRRTDTWNLIKDGMTLKEFFAAGGNQEDLNIIIRLGHAQLS